MHVERSLPNHSLAGYVTSYNLVVTDEYKNDILLAIINCLEPCMTASDRKFEGLQITAEIECLFLGGVKLTEHPILKACNILAKISGLPDYAETNRKLYSQDFLDVVSKIDNFAARHYLEYRFYYRTFQTKELTQSLSAALRANPGAAILNDALVRSIQREILNNTNLPYDATIATTLLDLNRDLECHKLRVYYFFCRDFQHNLCVKEITKLRESINLLIQAEPERRWHYFAISLDMTYCTKTTNPFIAENIEVLKQNVLFFLERNPRDQDAINFAKLYLDKQGSSILEQILAIFDKYYLPTERPRHVSEIYELEFAKFASYSAQLQKLD